MFEKIVLRRSNHGMALTAGELAEALLYYQNVHIVLDHGALEGLVPAIGMPTLLSLLAKPEVSAIYCDESLGVQTESSAGFETHSFIAFTFHGTNEAGAFGSRKRRLEYILQRLGYGRRESIRYTERLLQVAPVRKFSGDHFIPGGVPKATWDDSLDAAFVSAAVRRSLKMTVDQNDSLVDLNFKIHHFHPNFIVDTDIDFVRLNNMIKKRNPDAPTMSSAFLMEKILTARADTALAAHYGGEFYTSDVSSEIIRLRYSYLLRRIGIERDEQAAFTEMVVPNGRTVRDVINGKERTFDEFLQLLDKASKFKEWIRGVNPDEKLTAAYLRDITARGWINRLGGKSLRYVLGAGVAAVEPVIGLAVSAADSLLLDRILGGWRPNHFVERRLKPFMDDE